MLLSEVKKDTFYHLEDNDGELIFRLLELTDEPDRPLGELIENMNSGLQYFTYYEKTPFYFPHRNCRLATPEEIDLFNKEKKKHLIMSEFSGLNNEQILEKIIKKL